MRKTLLMMVVGCGGEPTATLPAPTLLAEYAGAVALASDGCYLWIENGGVDTDFQLVEGGPGCTRQVLDHAAFAPEFGGSYVIPGPDAIVWGEVGAFTGCGGMRVLDVAGPRSLQLADQCSAVAIDQFAGSVAIATTTDFATTDVDRVSLATGARTPWMRLDGLVNDVQRVDSTLYLSLRQTAGSYVAQVGRGSDGGAIPISFSNGAVDAAAFTPMLAGGVAMLDLGVGESPAQIMVPPNQLVADLGRVDLQGLYATDDGLWSVDVLNQAALNVALDGSITSYALAISEVPVRLLGDQLAVRDYDDYPAHAGELYLQPLARP